MTFPIVFDKKGEMMKAYNVMTIPTTFFFNEKGELEKTFVGPITVEQMKEWARQKLSREFSFFLNVNDN